MRTLNRIFFSVVLIASVPLAGWTEVNTGGINGTVTNSYGLPLSGAKVVATYVPSGALFGAISDENGLFKLPGLSIGGPYLIEVSLAGFKPYLKQDIYLILGDDYSIDVSLKAAELTIKTRKRIRDAVVVVLSMDGFRWDYPDRYHTPNLNIMARTGVKAASLQPSYPTKTFPNHYSIATGLYPDHHGIVQNSFYDPKLKRGFRMGDRSAVEDSIFWEGEAIWETAEMQGVKTAAYFWVGSESNETYRPGYRKAYESGFPYKQQIDTVLYWLGLPRSERPRLVMFYFDEPDATSHDFGPESKETQKVVEELDQLVGTIVSRLHRIEKSQGININFIVLSDHGMGAIPDGNTVFLEDLIDLKRIKRINGGSPVIILEPDPDYLEEAYQKLKASAKSKAWKKNELPAHYQYGKHQRIPELIVESNQGYGLEIRRKSGVTYSRGTHGYDPHNKDMHGIFYATGPAFKSGYVQPTFENVAIYGLLANILGLKPAANDGDFTTIRGVLKPAKNRGRGQTPSP